VICKIDFSRLTRLKFYVLACLFALLFLTLNTSYAQTIGISSGVSFGRFYNLASKNYDPHYESHYQSQFGSSFGFEVKDLALDSVVKIGLALSYENYGGQFLKREGGMNYSSTTQGQTTKHAIGIELYPLHLTLKNKFRLNIGLSYNRIVHYKLVGDRSWIIWSSPFQSGTEDLNDSKNFINKGCFCFIFSSGYEFKIGKLRFEPRYSYYLGMTSEFNGISAKSMRHKIAINVGYITK